MDKNIILTKSDLNSLRLSTKQYCSNSVFQEECLRVLSIKIHAFTKMNIDCKFQYYNKICKLSYFCDEGFDLKDDIDILFLEEGVAQYSYIKVIKDGIPEMRYVCHLYDDTYVSNSYFFEGEKDIISNFLNIYNYEYKHKIERKIKNKTVNKIMSNIKNDIQYKFLIEKYFSNELNVLNGLNEEDIIKTTNSFVSLKNSSIYEAIYNEIELSITFNLNKKIKEELRKYNSEMKSLNIYTYKIHENLYDFAKEFLEKKLIEYSSKGVFLLNELYKISYDIVCNIYKYNIIMSSIQKDVLGSLKKCGCKTFKVKYFGKYISCCSIRDVNREIKTYGLTYSYNDLMVVDIKGKNSDLSPEMRLTGFKDFEITYKSKTIYKLSDNIWSDLYECKSKILKLQEEQLMLAKSIVNANR